jgi:hypothetical protein
MVGYSHAMHRVSTLPSRQRCILAKPPDAVTRGRTAVWAPGTVSSPVARESRWGLASVLAREIATKMGISPCPQPQPRYRSGF